MYENQYRTALERNNEIGCAVNNHKLAAKLTCITHDLPSWVSGLFGNSARSLLIVAQLLFVQNSQTINGITAHTFAIRHIPT